MALHKRSSPSPPQNDLKRRVITCLNKLSDRDTLAVATTELESIARNLTHDSFSPFLTCIYGTDSSEKSPVRRQCVRLLGLLSQTHGDSLSPFLSKMLANVVRRLRDADSAVRTACVDAVAAMASQITKPPFSAFLKPLTDAILLEQDYNSQIGSTLCLAAAIEASPDPEPPQLQRLLPRLFKLLKSDSFKAKPALLSLVGSIVGAGGASSRNVLATLIPCMVEFLSSEDWAARKAAAEALARLAVAVESDLSSEFKSSCLASVECRRFDKVKVVRDTMNRALEMWKEVPGVSEEVLPPSQSKSSLRDNGSGGFSPPVSKSSCDVGFETPQLKKTIPTSRSPPSDNSFATTARKRSPLKSNDRKSNAAIFHKLDSKKPSDWKIEIALPHPPSAKVASEDGLKGRSSGAPESGENENSKNSRPETKRVLFNKTCDEKMHKFGGLRSGSRVVPFHENDNFESHVDSNATEEVHGNRKDIEDLSLIRKQLVQIENQQSSMFDLLQRFIGSSQNGMSSLETRVHGLEKALDEISYDLAVSTGRISNPDSSGNTCCMLPGAEFLSSKFWRRTEGQYSTSRFTSTGRTQSLTPLRNMPDKDASTKTFKLDSRRVEDQSGVGFVVNPLADIRSDSRGNLESYSNRTTKNINQDADKVQVLNAGGLDEASPAICMMPANLRSRSAASLKSKLSMPQ